MQSTNDTFFPFEQEANFWYLTGIEEPDWLLVIDGTRRSWLIAPEVESVHETFDGILALDDARRISGVDEVISSSEGERLLESLAKKHSVVHTIDDHPLKAHFNFTENPAQHRLKKRLERIFGSVLDCRKDIAKKRAIKQPEELAAIKKAIGLTAKAFTSVRQSINDFGHEYEIAAEFDYIFKRNNSTHAYTPIVAAGAQACTLHYIANSARLKKKQFVLLDVGARVDGYAADITRTYAYGEPTRRQQAVHAGLVAAQKEIIKLIGPGVVVADYSKQVDTIMKQTLHSLGLIADMNDDEGYHTYFPHAVSHGLGIDVHDSLAGARMFEPGMVLTVEPGIYLPDESIGIRIEDDIVVTESGYNNLSKALSTDY